MALSHSSKHFAEKLNYCLDETGAPAKFRDRVAVFSKMLDLPKQQAWNLLDGQLIPDVDLLNRISQEFEVDVKWLLDDK